MGDLSELRGLLTVVTFMGVFVLFLAWMPAEMFTVGEYRQVYTPEEFEAIEIYSFADYEVVLTNESSGHTLLGDSSIWVYEDFEIGNWDVDFRYGRPNMSNLVAGIVHEHWEWGGFVPDWHMLDWMDTSGVSRRVDGYYITVEDIENNKEVNGYISRWRCPCPHFTLYTVFSFNNTAYYSFEDAWNGGELRCFFGINYDDVNTSYNAFQLISMLLFFSLPSMPIYITAPISIVMWICICYLLYVLILKAIPLVGD